MTAARSDGAGPRAGTLRLESLAPRACPVCGDVDATHERYAARGDIERLGALSYASRKEPEAVSLRMVVCPACDLLYAPQVPSESFLARAYADTGYDSSAEAYAAAVSYAAALEARVDRLPDRASALEIGTGNGALLPHLAALGFEQLIGVEPSRAAAQAAAPAVRPWIRIESFDAARFPAAHFTLIIANQTLEHVRDPRGLLAAARALLKPGGALLTVSHNYRHWLMRLLGARSPIIDVEHLQLFSPASLAFALARAGFVDCEIRPFANRYPLDYWLRLAPLPRWVKRPWYGWLRRRTGGGHWMLRASVGNMLAWAATSGGGEEKYVHGTALRIASQPKNATVLGCDG